MHVASRKTTFIVALVAVLVVTSCGSTGAGRPTIAEVKQQANQARADAKVRAPYGQPARIATLEDPAVNESSGLVASRRNPGLFWTHNDSGDAPILYAFDRAGKRRGAWRVAGARSVDWEDAAAGPGPEAGRSYLYVGDIGDNGHKRSEIVVYRVAEPEIRAGANSTQETEPAETIRLRYPDGSRDAEALLVHPSTGDIYVVTKTASGAAGVYKLAAPPSASSVNTLVRVAEVRLPGLFGGFITGGDISPDGRRVVLCDYLNAYEFSLPDGAKFDGVWGQTPQTVELGERRQGETVCYGADGEAIYATSEKKPVPLIEVKREPQGK
jgi:hypothetical protein